MNRCLSKKIAGTLREELSDGRYRVGQRLPGVAALRARFGAGEFAVRHALQMLRDEGFLTLKPHIGAVGKRGCSMTKPTPARCSLSRLLPIAAALICAAGCVVSSGAYHHPDGRSYADFVWKNVLPAVENETVTLTNMHGTAKVSLVGANVFSYVPAGGDEVLFSVKDPDFTLLRFPHAGIPVVWPWFGWNGEAGTAIHGFARRMKWTVLEKAETPDVSRLVLELVSDERTRAMWPYDFRLVYTVTLCDRLLISLATTNTGTIPFEITEGLHPYFRVSDVDTVVLRGLDGCLNDSIHSHLPDKEFEGDLRFQAGENRAFTPGKGEYVLFDEGANRAICLAARGHRKLNLWSIPESSCKGLFSGDDWKHFACLEPATISREAAVTVLPGKRHELLMSVKTVPIRR